MMTNLSDLKQKRALLCTITLLFWFSQYIYLPYMTPYMLSIKISASLAGVIVGMYGLMQLILRIPIGVVADLMRNSKFFICVATVLAAASPLPRIFFPNAYTLLLSNCLDGIASAMWIMFTILFASYYNKEETTKAMGTINIFFNTGIMIAYLMGGVLYDRLGVDSLFILSSIVAAAAAVMSFLIKKETTESTNVSFVNLLGVMKSKHLWKVSTLSSFLWFLLFATVFSFTTSTAKGMGATGTQLCILTACYGIATIIGSYFISKKISARLETKTIVTIFFLFFAIYCCGISVAHSLIIFYPLQFLSGLASGGLSSILMGCAVKDVDPEKRSTAMGFYASVYCIGMTVGPIIMGVLIQYTTLFISFGVMALVAVFCAVLGQLFLAEKVQTEEDTEAVL